jgi:hypothetical protein
MEKTTETKIYVIPKQDSDPAIKILESETIGKEIASFITGTLKVADLYDPKTSRFLSEEDLTKKGAVILTIDYETAAKLNKTNRETKQPCPYKNIRKKQRYQKIVNVDWQSYINSRSEHGEFVASPERANKVANFEDCKAIGTTKAGNFTINGVILKMLEGPIYLDENDTEIAQRELAPYLPSKKKNREREAKKHGIEVEFDPQYRTTRIDSCLSIRVFGSEYQPITNK